MVRDGGAAPPAFLVVGSLASLRPQPQPGSAPADTSGARPAPFDVGLAALLVTMAVDRPRVQVTAVGDEPIAGQLRSVGVDVLTLRLDGDAGLRAHVRLAAVAELLLLDL